MRSLITAISGSALWEIADVFGLLLVTIGVFFETPPKRARLSAATLARIEPWGHSLVRWGLALELVATPLVIVLNHREIAALEASTASVVARTSNVLAVAAEHERQAGEALASASAMADRAAEANARAAEANEHAKQAEARAAEADERTEKERDERLRVERERGARSLTKEQQADLKAALEPFRGLRLNFFTVATYEAEGFRDALVPPLKDAGWLLTMSGGIPWHEMAGVIILVRTDTDDATISAGRALAEWLRGHGTQTEGPVKVKAEGIGPMAGTFIRGESPADAPMKVIVGQWPP
jgi:hypothetical protein